MASSICVRMRVAETRKKNYKAYEENQKIAAPTQSSTWNTSSTSILK